MLSIRLARVGRVNLPAFRVVVQEKTRSPRSKVVEILGQYDPKTEPAKITIDQERLNHWISVGARPTIAVADILVKQDLLKLEQVPQLQHERARREASKKRVSDKKDWQAKVVKEKKKRAEAKAKSSGDNKEKSAAADKAPAKDTAKKDAKKAPSGEVKKGSIQPSSTDTKDSKTEEK